MARGTDRRITAFKSVTIATIIAAFGQEQDICMMQAEIGVDLERAAKILAGGGLVAIPTETVYGLAANALDPEAVLRIFMVKQRPSFDPLIVHIGRREELDRIVSVLPPHAEALMDAFWPGPLTLVLPKRPEIPDVVTSGLDTVAVRMPSHPLALRLLKLLPFPLAAPSANPFGYVSPTTPEHVAAQLGDRIDHILDGGPCTVGVESTILGWEPEGPNGQWVLYRPGGLPVEEIEKVIGPVGVGKTVVHPVAPGMLDSHYSPRTPLYVGDVPTLIQRFSGRRLGVISFKETYEADRCFVLSRTGDLSEAARNLFAALRQLDNGVVDVILAERFPDSGLGMAINDRLRRASIAE
jgi:L-threonylcarbamoyladenylate synthase